MTRKQLQQATGTRSVPDLWHFAPGGSMGTANLGSNLYDLAAQADTAAEVTCEQCGSPTCGLSLCDGCMDNIEPAYLVEVVEGGDE